MTIDKMTFEQKLAKLKQEYALQLPNKLAEILSHWNELKTQWSADTIIVLHRNIHSLIGTSGTFGFTELSKSARILETTLKPLIENESENFTLSSELDDEISEKINTLFSLADSTQNNKKANIDEQNKKATLLGEQLSAHNTTGNSGTAGDNTVIYYVDDDLAGPSLLTQQLCSYGFKASHFRTIHDFKQALDKEKPNLVMFDMVMPDASEREIFDLAKEIHETGIKVLFLSGKDDFLSRLESVRAGAHAYLNKPADVPSLVGLIRSALQMNAQKPPHVLIVDDQESVAQFYSNVLTQAGMKTTVELNAFNTFNVMKANVPDLLLLDLHMPNIHGNELAAIIRQQEQYQSIPILFLSAEFSAEKKTSLLEIGSDDLLPKGIPPEELVRHIKSRIARARTLTAMMYQDSLTGLLNHAQIQLAAERVFNQSKRQAAKFCIAMIDIDYFKKVNDTYGHLTGDRVIKALAHLLEQRFRITDYVGRFGGEEFMLVLPDISVNDAGNLINNLRKAFAAIDFKEDDTKFNVSFSAGVAENTDMENFIAQIKSADEALYRAKARGRNVVCAHLSNDS